MPSHFNLFHDPDMPLTENKQQEFVVLMQNFFRPYVGAMSPSDDMKHCIWRSLEVFAYELNHKKLADIYIDILFSFFEVLYSIDSDIIQNTLEYFVLRKLKNVLQLKDLDFLDEAPTPLRCRTYGKCRVPVNCVPRQIPKIPTIMALHNYKKDFKIDSFFYQPYVLMNYNLTRRMLRYGVKFTTDVDDLQHYLAFNLFSVILASEMINLQGNQMFLTLVNSMYSTPRKLRRLYLITLAIELILVHEKPQFLVSMQRSYIKSMKLLFRTIPDPLVTIKEIARLFYIVSGGGSGNRPILEFCKVFLENFPKSMQPLQPRRLKHLARCQVRENLWRTRTLPHGVWRICVPFELRNYLLLQRREDEFLLQYVAFLFP